LKINWSDGISEGGTPILDYRVDYEELPGKWIELATGLLTREYLSSFSVVEGKTYQLAVRARNSVGLSSYSTTLPVLAA
jgi:hypothetical protein